MSAPVKSNGRLSRLDTHPVSEVEASHARALLACALLDWEIAKPHFLSVPIEVFPGGALQGVAEAVHEVHRRGGTPDQATVAADLMESGRLEDAGGIAFIADLVDHQATSANAEFFAEELQRLARPRILSAQLEAASRYLLDPTADHDAVLTDVRGLLDTQSRDGKHIQDFVPCDTDVWAASAAPPIDWLFDGLLARGELGFIAGGGGLGKSWLALLLGLSAATGRAFLPGFRPTRPVKSLMLLGEDSEHTVWRRFRSIGGFNADPNLRRENFHVIAHQAEPLVAYSGANPCRTARWHWLREFIQTRRYEFIVLDPLSRWHSIDENDAACMTAVVQALEALTPSGTVLFLHHVRKASQGSLDSEAARGSSALRDGVRWQANMAPITESEARAIGADSVRGYVKLDISKANNVASLPEPFLFKRGAGGCLEQVDTRNARALAFTSAVAEWLALHPDASIPHRDIQRRAAGSCEALTELMLHLKATFGRRGATWENLQRGVAQGIRSGAIVLKDEGGRQEICAPWERVQYA